MSVKNRDRKKERNTVIIHYVNVSVLIKFILPTFDNQTLASCNILHVSVKTRDKRRKHSNKSCRERLRIHEAHIRSFDIQTSASCKILHLSVKTKDRKKGRNTVIVYYVNVSVLIKFILLTFDNQTSASRKILHLSEKTETERKEETQY